MQTKHLCVLIHIWTKGEVGAPWNQFEPSIKINTNRSKEVLLLCIICFINVLCLPCIFVCSLLPCGHLKRKGWPLGSCLWCLSWFCYYPIWYPGTGVVLDCIDSWSLLSFLLLLLECKFCIISSLCFQKFCMIVVSIVLLQHFCKIP